MREICFDTETTGLRANEGDRIIELGCVELVNLIPTGREFHRFINPGRAVSADTIRITGITDDMLRDKPSFNDPDVGEAFLDFVGDAPLVAHNAEFDRGFINAEFARFGASEFPKERFVDTLVIARNKFPGASNTLDALCKRFDISIEHRDLHGAVKDSRLLAAVYLELMGGRAHSFDFEIDESAEQAAIKRAARAPRPKALAPLLTEEEAARHAAFVKTLGDAPIWNRYLAK